MNKYEPGDVIKIEEDYLVEEANEITKEGSTSRKEYLAIIAKQNEDSSSVTQEQLKKATEAIQGYATDVKDFVERSFPCVGGYKIKIELENLRIIILEKLPKDTVR